ncbi:MAG: hypothetical protein J1G06_02600 [Oscillospiraceae bacterium]|nr:hypothetical protein [Oscillospiraceae bacterium]
MFKHFTLFVLGGISYLLIELLWRGRSHWAMFVLGGICFLLIGAINEANRRRIPMLLQAFMGSVIITALEFATGYIVNIKLHMNVWSYYDIPYNIMGQICLPYMILWFFLSIVCVFADDWLRYYLFDEERPKYKWF